MNNNLCCERLNEHVSDGFIKMEVHQNDDIRFFVMLGNYRKSISIAYNLCCRLLFCPFCGKKLK